MAAAFPFALFAFFLLFAGDTGAFALFSAPFHFAAARFFLTNLFQNGVFAGLFTGQGIVNSLVDTLFALDFLLTGTLELVHKNPPDFDFFHVIIHDQFLGQALEHFRLELAGPPFSFNNFFGLGGIVFKQNIIEAYHAIEVVFVFFADHFVAFMGHNFIADLIIGIDKLPEVEAGPKIRVFHDNICAHDGRAHRGGVLQFRHEGRSGKFTYNLFYVTDAIEGVEVFVRIVADSQRSGLAGNFKLVFNFFFTAANVTFHLKRREVFVVLNFKENIVAGVNKMH